MTARVFTLALALLAGGASIGAQDRTVELLRLLSDTAGAPGFEEPIRKVMVDQMRPLRVGDHLRRPRLDHRHAGHHRAAHHGGRPHGRTRRHGPPHHAPGPADDADAGRVAGSGAGRSALDDHRRQGPGQGGHRHPRRARGARRRADARLPARQPVPRCRRHLRGRGARDGHLGRRSDRAGRAVRGAERHRPLPRQGMGRPRRLRRRGRSDAAAGHRAASEPDSPGRSRRRRRSACAARTRRPTW